MTINKSMFTSKTPEWETPQDFFDKLDKEFNFVQDVCATKENAKCRNFISKEIDGLNTKWQNKSLEMDEPTVW